MELQPDASLLPYNTFGIDVRSRWFAQFDSAAGLRSLLRSLPAAAPVLILGGGSNMLFTADWPGAVLRNAILGMEIIRHFPHRVWVRVGAGENWHSLVEWAVGQNLGGIENLSLIPGTTGAAPVQNIGAYGVELKDVFVKLEAMELATGKIRVFNKKACRFGYRDSIFKHEAKGRYCITYITLSLSTGAHRLRTGYGDILRKLSERNIAQPTIADLSSAIIDIRRSKLPDPAVIGNCGSFFKNPEVERSIWEKIAAQFPTAPHFDLPNGRVKVPAGWLIEQCGWKGKRVGNTGSYEKQALVLVNYGGATGAEVRRLALDIIASVEEKFGVLMEAEVNVL